MPRVLPMLTPSMRYALRGGFLLRPFAIALTLGVMGAVLSSWEQHDPAIDSVVPEMLFPTRGDPQVAQAILSDIATSVMTVVSIVFAILLMTLTLASTQFSPRILISFVRDQVTQWTLGVFLGTFTYCIAALPAAHSLPRPFVPVLTVDVAMLLAPVCVGLLIYFIHHISNAISVNTIIDRIRRETELVIDELMPDHCNSSQRIDTTETLSGKPVYPIASRQSGYVRFIDIQRLTSLAKAYRISLRVERRVGYFVPEGVTLVRVSHGDRITEECQTEILSAIDIGPVRTMQQDIEFGIVQIVDIALKAMSPAVNDPTTAISCVDQLSCILIRWLSRTPSSTHYYNPPNVLRVVVPRAHFKGLLDLAFEQIRHYAVADAAVSLRLMRAFCDISSTVTDPKTRHDLIDRGRHLIEAGNGHIQSGDRERLRKRLALLESGATEED